jgi:predicted TIM-barrel fold metal-dependent hydrolase
MRALASFVGGGIMDRYPEIKFAVLESGFGWLPFWARRMDDQAVYVGYTAEGLQHKPSEYVAGGRFACGIVLHEGEDMVKLVNSLLGDHLLMFGSDYPHAESRFPESVDRALAWNQLNEHEKHALLWDNAVRFFGEP